MTTSNPLRAAWAALESERDRLPGLYERRVYAHSAFAIYAGLVRPAMHLRFSLSVPASIETDGLERKTRGFAVHCQYIITNRSTRVTLELGHPTFRELFEVMAEDVAARVLAAADESAAVAAVRERLNHWERFMRASGPGGLSREDQLGLFGELSFLQTMLLSGAPSAMAVRMWTGPGGANQDYTASGCALEVKTTSGNAATSAMVSNELQLDETDNRLLFLLHLWLRVQAGIGETLPRLVNDISASLTGLAAEEFGDRLVQAGYHDVHRALYEDTGYVERARCYYAVGGTFPRIRQVDLRPGVSRVAYTIDVAGFEGFQRQETEVIQALVDDHR